MASDKIKGLSVKIGADTSDFIKELKKVDKEINQTQKTANELQKGLQLDFNDKRFIQAQKQVQNALKTTEDKAEAIRKQLKFLEETGGVNTEGYQKLQTELAKSETKALQLKQQLDDIDKIKFDNATRGVTNLSKELETAAKNTKGLSIASAAAIAGIYKLGSDSAATGGNLQDMADRLNITAEALQRYDYIALQSGVETEQLVKSMAKARDAVGTALSGQANTATASLEKLFGSLNNIPSGTEESFVAIIDKLAQVEDKTLQAYYANEIFGERLATNLIPMINNGADKISKFNAEFETIGYLSNEQVQALADFDDELNIMREKMELAKIELGMSMIPIMENFVEIIENYIVPAIQKLSNWFNDLPEPMQNVISGGLLLLATLSPIFTIMSKMIGVGPKLIKFFKDLNVQTLKTYAGFAALAGALTLSLDIIKDWSEMSAIEKVLKTLAVAALTAAAAMTIFHASWSVGIAVGAIAAAVTAGIAMISAAGKDIGIDTKFKSQSDIEGYYSNNDYKIPSSYNGNSSSYQDNSQYNIEINMNPTGDLNYDAKELADEVIKQIVVKKQASGR